MMPSKMFPKISDDEMRRMLEPPSGPVRVVIDTDTKNEIDDQFALAWALLSQEVIKLEGVYAAPFSFGIYQDDLVRAYDVRRKASGSAQQELAITERFGAWLEYLESINMHPKDIHFDGPDVGMERSYEEILVIFEKVGENPDGLVFHGSRQFMSSPDKAVRSPAVEHLIELALKQDDKPLYVVAIAAITNIVSAILLAPEIIQNIVVIWTSSYPSTVNVPTYSLNLEQDMIASQIIFNCGVPLVYLPGHHVGAQLRLSLPEMEAWVRGQSAIGDYLYWLFTHNPLYAQRGITDHFGRSWVIWDVINIAWLLNSSWVPSVLTRAPRLKMEKRWDRSQPNGHFMREAYGVDRDGIFRDFFAKLRQASSRSKNDRRPSAQG